MIRRKPLVRKKPLGPGKVRMRQGRSTGKPTKAEAARIEAVKFLGCLCCRQRGIVSGVAEYHHLLSGGRRRGHMFGIGLCSWHHRAAPFGRWPNARACRDELGPSLNEGSRLFHIVFGSDAELLAQQNGLLGADE